jgi:DNA end-binding protein Ku
LVVLTDEDFADLPLPTTKTVDVHEFVPLEQVDPIYFAKTYYLEPEKGGVKPYVLLRQALSDSGMVALVKVAIRSREQLAVLRVRDEVLVMETMVWPDEVRAAKFAFLDEAVDVRPQELQMASSLIASMKTDFDPSKYSDEYRDALQAVIDAKVVGQQLVTAPVAGSDAGGVVDLMSALRASVDAAKAKRAESTGAGVEPAPGSSRAARKKPPTKAVAAKAEAGVTQPAARKASARKSA